MSKKETAVEVVSENTFMIAAPGGTDVLAQILEMGIEDHELPIVKVPGGGGTTWELPLADGIVATPTLDVIIALPRGGVRAYHAVSLDDSDEPSAPDCQSDGDPEGTGALGYGAINVGDKPSIRPCMDCPKNVWGSAGEGKRGKACAENWKVYAFVRDEMRPIRIQVPPKSLKACRKYLGDMVAKRGLGGFARVVTRLTLRKEAKPKPHAVIEFKFLEELPNEAAETMVGAMKRLDAAYPVRTAAQIRSQSGDAVQVEATVEKNDPEENWEEA